MNTVQSEIKAAIFSAAYIRGWLINESGLYWADFEMLRGPGLIFFTISSKNSSKIVREMKLNDFYNVSEHEAFTKSTKI